MTFVKDGNFIIDGKPVFLFGGEVHYFRLPKDCWEDRIIKVKQAGGNLVSTYIPWIIHEDIQGDIDVSGKRRAENDLGYFLDLIKKHDMYCIVRPGPYIMSELKNEGLPEWIYTEYPDSLACGKKGEIHPTRSVYLLDETYLQLVDNWYKALGDIIRPRMEANGGPIIMSQLDNEIGMMHWCSGTADYTRRNIDNFKQYLTDEFADGKRYGVEMDSDSFYEFVCNPPKEYAQKVRLDLSKYTRLYFRRYFEKLQEIFVEHMGETLFILNVHGFDSTDIVKRGKQYPIGTAQLSEAAKARDTVTAGDYYIGNLYYDNVQDIMLANAFTKAVQNPEQPLFSAEFQGGFQVDTPRMQPTTYDLTTRLCVANGMNGINYYMFAGGTNIKGTDLLGLRHSWQAPVDTDGSLKPHYNLIKHLGNVLEACSDSLLETKPETVVTLGLIPDYYMTEYSDSNTKEICAELKLYRENCLYDGMGKAMTLLNISYEGFDISGNEAIDVDKMPVMAAFSTRYMEANIQKKLLAYVENGGKLLLFPTVPIMDMEGNACTILKDALGCKAEFSNFGFIDHIDDIENIITFGSCDFGDVENGYAKHEKGHTCGFMKKIGKGEINAFGIAMQHDYYYRDQIVLNQFEKLDVTPLVKSERIDDKLLLQTRKNDSGGRYLFIINVDEYEKTTSFSLNGEALFDGKKFDIRQRSGLILPLNINFANDFTVEYSTAEITAFSEPAGAINLTLALTQAEDCMIVKTQRKVLENDNIAVTNLSDGRIKITSKKHGAICKSIDIQFS